MTYRILPMLAVSMIGIGLAIAAPVGAYFWSRDPGPAQTMERLTAERLLPEDINRPHTVKSRLNSFGPSARTRLKKAFLAAPLPYPPAEIVLLGLKHERLLELYGRAPGDELRFIKSYPFAAWTGRLGPKLREGDRQIPEGVYGIDYLNPNSIAYVSLRIGYPNAFERARGQEDGRTELGGDIMIHGKTGGSEGCIVVENSDIEELFTLAADTGIHNIRVLLAPTDLRRNPAPTHPGNPSWTDRVYADLIQEMAEIPMGKIQVAGD
ncbi:L,D-transpeptidase family protein [Hwanghaeella sp. 1Z406]|uniref:L,D-transpeptidase family protein n=1 Tax=Hwanghaeella sp. 1Z406 TaxID=3402811 RepID=UPI003B66DC52